MSYYVLMGNTNNHDALQRSTTILDTVLANTRYCRSKGGVDITHSPIFFPANFIVTVSNANPSAHKHPARDSTAFTKCYQHSGDPPYNGRFKVHHWLLNQAIEATQVNIDMVWVLFRWIWNTERLYCNPGQAGCYYFHNYHYIFSIREMRACNRKMIYLRD